MRKLILLPVIFILFSGFLYEQKIVLTQDQQGKLDQYVGATALCVAGPAGCPGNGAGVRPGWGVRDRDHRLGITRGHRASGLSGVFEPDHQKEGGLS